MGDPDDGMLANFLALALHGKTAHERLGMLVNHVAAGRLVPESRDIGIVAIDEDARVGRLERRGQEIGGPKDARLGGPGGAWMAIETVNEDNVDFGFGMAIDLGDFVRTDLIQ